MADVVGTVIMQRTLEASAASFLFFEENGTVFVRVKVGRSNGLEVGESNNNNITV
ncbi:MAG: hypothetical protein LBB06_02210 [Endomicrobium sp.]|jgi:hypothetical protein|nr:hypothetical protein [Endomicrobium sp.]